MMNFEYSRQAVKAIKRMDSSTKSRVHQGILKIPDGYIKKLHGVDNVYRLHIGDWRILFSREDNNIINIIKIVSRGKAYKEG